MSATLTELLRDAKVELVVARCEKDSKIIDEVIDHLKSDSRSIRFNASLALGELGEKASESVASLIECLAD